LPGQFGPVPHGDDGGDAHENRFLARNQRVVEAVAPRVEPDPAEAGGVLNGEYSLKPGRRGASRASILISSLKAMPSEVVSFMSARMERRKPAMRNCLSFFVQFILYIARMLILNNFRVNGRYFFDWLQDKREKKKAA
jgi:hypothetical protein